MALKASDGQIRSLRYLQKKFPTDVKSRLDNFGGVIENLTVEQAASIIDDIRELYPPRSDQEPEKRNEKRSSFRPGSKQDVIARVLRQQKMNVDAAYKVLRPSLGQGVLKFQRNEGGRRVPLPIDKQEIALLNSIRQTKRIMEKNRLGQLSEEDMTPQEKLRNDAEQFLRWVRNLREFCAERAADGHRIDEIGLRPVQFGARMLVAGIPIPAIKYALTMHFPADVRKELGIRNYDVTEFEIEKRKEGVHSALPYCLALADARIPIALIGPKGTGKTTLAMQIAEYKRIPFAAASMTNGTSPSAFNGRPKIGSDGTAELVLTLVAKGEYEEAHKIALGKQDAGDVAISQFEIVYGGGGVFLFDEMDAANENLLLIVNAAIANGWFFNTATGRKIEQHPDFIPIAGMNTLGLGAQRDYNSRNKLDAATLDRWNAGRVRIELDERIEHSMFWEIIDA